MESGKSLIEQVRPHQEDYMRTWLRINSLLSNEARRLGKKLEQEDINRVIKNSIDLEDKSNGE